MDGQAARREEGGPGRDPGQGARGGRGRAGVERGGAVGLPRRRGDAVGPAGDHPARLGRDLEAAPASGGGVGAGRCVRPSGSHRDGRVHRRRGRGDDGRRTARALSPRGRPAARRFLPRGHAPRWRRPRAAAAAAGESRRRDRARRGRGDDEGARHRLPPQPARGLAHRDPRPPAPPPERLRPRAVHRDLFASSRPHRKGLLGEFA